MARCYAHNPIGALLAAAQIPYRLTISSDWRLMLNQQVMPGPGRAAFIRIETESATNPGPPTPAGGYAQIAAFLFVTYTPQMAVIDLVSRGEEGGMAVGTYTVEWSDGDWKIALQPSGPVTPPTQDVTSTVGYVMWGGV
jgi:hypothetical protein